MLSFSGVFEPGGRPRAVVRAAFVFVGSLVAAVGFVATIASLVAGLGFMKSGALKIAALLGGAFPFVAFLVRPLRQSSESHTLVLATAGVVVGVVGLGLFWITLPEGWTGNLARLPSAALGIYAVGLVAAFGARLTAETGDRAQSSDANTDGPIRDGDSLRSVDGVVPGRVTKAESDRLDDEDSEDSNEQS